MASTAAALSGALLAAVCFVLLHSSMGQPPMPTPNCPDHTGQQPAPPLPTPIPTPTPAPAPATAPAPTPTPPPPPPREDCYNSCASGCNTNCSSYFAAAIKQCDAQSAAAFSSCYDGCTSRECPGKSCVHSGCASGNCTCENPNARTCCESCLKTVSYASYQCRSSVDGGSHMYYCMLACTSNCNKNCV